MLREEEAHEPEALAGIQQYGELLQLVCMCVAGYQANKDKTSSSKRRGGGGGGDLWRDMCRALLARPALQPRSGSSPLAPNGVAYLRAACRFLYAIADLPPPAERQQRQKQRQQHQRGRSFSEGGLGDSSGGGMTATPPVPVGVVRQHSVMAAAAIDNGGKRAVLGVSPVSHRFLLSRLHEEEGMETVRVCLYESALEHKYT